MKFQVWIELELVSGPAQDEETMVDAFCGTIGEQNGAKPPVYIVAGKWDDTTGELVESKYLVRLVDDRG